MVILYVLLALIIYTIIVIGIGTINFNEKYKKNILIASATVYNCFIGYIDIPTIFLLYGYLCNHPNGTGYAVPDSEIGLNLILGFITLIIYLILLIPINIFMKKKGKINLKFYMIANIIATVLGIALFCIFLDKKQKLF